jgi:hypothetical protein
VYPFSIIGGVTLSLYGGYGPDDDDYTCRIAVLTTQWHTPNLYRLASTVYTSERESLASGKGLVLNLLEHLQQTL